MRRTEDGESVVLNCRYRRHIWADFHVIGYIGIATTCGWLAAGSLTAGLVKEALCAVALLAVAVIHLAVWWPILYSREPQRLTLGLDGVLIESPFLEAPCTISLDEIRGIWVGKSLLVRLNKWHTMSFFGGPRIDNRTLVIALRKKRKILEIKRSVSYFGFPAGSYQYRTTPTKRSEVLFLVFQLERPYEPDPRFPLPWGDWEHAQKIAKWDI